VDWGIIAANQCCGGTFLTRNALWLIDFNVFMERINQHFDGQREENFDVRAFASQSSWNLLAYLSIRSRTILIHDSVGLLTMKGVRTSGRSRECPANMQLLTLALLLYEKEHGSMPDGDWREAIKTAERAAGRKPAGDAPKDLPADLRPPLFVFRCPSHPGLAEDETTYAMVTDVPNVVPSPTQILLVETREPQKDGRIAFEQATFENSLSNHHGGDINVGLRSGAIRSLSKDINPVELRKLFDGSSENTR